MCASHEPNECPSLELELLGASVRVVAKDRGFIDGLSQCFSPARRAPFSGARDLRVQVSTVAGGASADRGRYSVTTQPEDSLDERWLERLDTPLELCSALNSWAAFRASRYYVFHAGAVARGRHALLVPGCSGAGKSTLTAALLRSGFALLSDEIGAVDMLTGGMTAYPRRLSIRADVAPLLGLAAESGYGTPGESARMIDPAEFGGVRARGRPNLALILAPRYRPDGAVELERLSTGDAVMHLLNCSCTHLRLQEQALDWLIDLARRIPMYRLHFPDLAAAVRATRRAWSLHIETV